ncbi:MAG: glycosyltransferase family 9 protein [Planctomycetes bacterium]|nr:glycosyltransferase family 9 protein [Planctomycetota bacterium]
MKRILVIQLHRFGDIIETTPLFPALKEKYHKSYLAVVAQRDYAEVLIGNPYVDEIFLFDKGGLIKEIQCKDIPLKASYDKIHAFIEELRKRKFDLVINISSDDLSALIAYLLKVRDTKGVSYAEDGFRYHRQKWMIYFFSLLKHRIYNSFNMVDIHLGVGEIPFGRRSAETSASSVEPLSRSQWQPFLPIDGESKAFSERFYKENGITDNDFVVGFQLGASRAHKTWPSKYFARLGDELIKNEGAKLILFGHPLEVQLGKDVCSLMNNKPINAIGKTNIKQLGAMLQRCQYLISNDTLTAHIAAAVGTKVIGIFLSTCFVHDTAPYGEGHLLLQPNLFCQPCTEATLCKELRCRDLISPEMVLSTMRIVDCSERNNSALESVDVSLYRTQFDCDGMLECVPIIKRHLTDGDILRYCYRNFWKGYLGVSRKITEAKDFFNEIEKYYTIEASLIDLRLSSGRSLKKHIQSFNELSTLCGAGVKLINMGTESASFSERIGDIDRKIIEIEGCASFLTNLYVIEKTNMAEDITALTKRDILELYMRTQRNARLMKGMLLESQRVLRLRS